MDRIRNYWPYWKRFGLQGRVVAQTLFPNHIPARGSLGEVSVPRLKSKVSFRYGTSDASVFTQVFVDRCYQAKLPHVPSRIIDAGANVGYSALYYAREYPTAEIVALEAEESNYKLAQMNLSSYTNVHPMFAALWYEDGTVSLESSDSTHSSFRFDSKDDGTHTVPSISPNTILKKMGWSEIDLFKVNIEGGEKSLFENEPLDWVPKVRTFVMDLHDRFLPGCSNAVENALKPWNFKHESVGELHMYSRP